MKINLYLLIFFILLASPCARAAEISSKPEDAEVKLLTISKGIEILLQDNRLIRIALPDKDMAFQDSLIARSALLPQFNITASKRYNQYQPAMKFASQNVNTSDKNPFSYGFSVYQTLYDFGKSLSYYKASKEMLQATQANIESTKRLAAIEFITAYFNLLESEKMITVFEKEVESLTSYLNDIEQLFKFGAAVKNDLLPAKVKLADTKQKLIATRNDREIIVAQLNNILALPLRQKIKAEDIKMESANFPEMEAAWDIAQIQRPEVAFYESQIHASISAERAKAVENFPVLFAGGNYSYAQNKFQVHEENISVELGAKINFYDGGASRAELLKERTRQKKLKEEKNKIVEDIKFEIEDSYLDLKDACEKVSVAKEALAQAQENVRFYRVKYSAGSATPTDILEAIALQTRAQTNYYSDNYELKRSYAKLMYSMGIDLGLIYERMENK